MIDESHFRAETAGDPSATSRFSAITRSSIESSDNIRGFDGDDLAAIDALPATSALLIARKGPNAGARFLLNADVVNAGRSTKANIFLDDVTVSRKHAQFLREGTTFIVKDSGSLNGTYVNGEITDIAELKNGDEVRIGKFQFTFFASPEVA